MSAPNSPPLSSSSGWLDEVQGPPQPPVPPASKSLAIGQDNHTLLPSINHQSNILDTYLTSLPTQANNSSLPALQEYHEQVTFTVVGQAAAFLAKVLVDDPADLAAEAAARTAKAQAEAAEEASTQAWIIELEERKERQRLQKVAGGVEETLGEWLENANWLGKINREDVDTEMQDAPDSPPESGPRQERASEATSGGSLNVGAEGEEHGNTNTNGNGNGNANGNGGGNGGGGSQKSSFGAPGSSYSGKKYHEEFERAMENLLDKSWDATKYGDILSEK